MNGMNFFLEILKLLTVSNGVRRKFGPVSSKIVFRSKDSIIVPADELSEPASGRAERASERASGRAGGQAGGRAGTDVGGTMLLTEGFLGWGVWADGWAEEWVEEWVDGWDGWMV
jgi:hypothetical protein